MKLNGRRVEGEDTSPGCVFGVITRDATDDLILDVQDLKAEVKWVRMTIVAAIVTATVGTLARMMGG